MIKYNMKKIYIFFLVVLTILFVVLMYLKCERKMIMDRCYKTTETIKFGRYKNTKDGKVKPIEWYVRNKIDDIYILCSKEIIDCVPYNDEIGKITWEECSLRKWLNEDFYNVAFNDGEKKMIVESDKLDNDEIYKMYDWMPINTNKVKDKVSIFSYSEWLQSLTQMVESKKKPTEYAKSKDIVISDDGYSSFWIRSDTVSEYKTDTISCNGLLMDNIEYMDSKIVGVSPVICVKRPSNKFIVNIFRKVSSLFFRNQALKSRYYR